MRRSTVAPAYLKSFVFGVEDSLVSTVGFISGIAAVGASRGSILLAGTVLIFVEAFSMAAGEFLSESSAQEFTTRREANLWESALSGFVMFASYIVSGFFVLIPYLTLLPSEAFFWSITTALIALFLLGIVSARISKTSRIKKAALMVGVGGAAILLGVIVGHLVPEI